MKYYRDSKSVAIVTFWAEFWDKVVYINSNGSDEAEHKKLNTQKPYILVVIQCNMYV